jgi:hypothetical protein
VPGVEVVEAAARDDAVGGQRARARDRGGAVPAEALEVLAREVEEAVGG